jgi:DNA-binding response OmpR family regulator
MPKIAVHGVRKGREKMMRVEKNVSYRPLLILAYADSAHAARCGRYFRRLGWEVRLVASAAEARRLSSTWCARAVVLDTELPDESGWLTCAKITHGDPSRKVILLAPKRAPETPERLADVSAAALVTRHDDMEALAAAVLGRQLAEAV